MEVVVQTHSSNPSALRSHAQQRVRETTWRMASVIRRAVVRLKDLNGPRGGVDKACQVQISTVRGDVLVVHAKGPTWHVALEDALTRSAQLMQRRLQALKPRKRPKLDWPS